MKNTFINIQQNVFDENDGKAYNWFYDIDNEYLYRINTDKHVMLKPYYSKKQWMILLFLQAFFLPTIALAVMANNFSDNTVTNIIIGSLMLIVSALLLYVFLVDDIYGNYEKRVRNSQHLIAKKSDIYNMWLQKNRKQGNNSILLFLVSSYGVLLFLYLTRNIPAGYDAEGGMGQIRLAGISYYFCAHIFAFIHFRVNQKFKNATKNKDELTRNFDS